MDEKTRAIFQIIRNEVVYYANLAYKANNLEDEQKFENMHKAVKELENKVRKKLKDSSSN